MFVPNLDTTTQHQVTIDDEKVHLQTRHDTAGLKLVCHVKDNICGHTLHTMVLSYSQMPIQIAWKGLTSILGFCSKKISRFEMVQEYKFKQCLYYKFCVGMITYKRWYTKQC